MLKIASLFSRSRNLKTRNKVTLNVEAMEPRALLASNPLAVFEYQPVPSISMEPGTTAYVGSLTAIVGRISPITIHSVTFGASSTDGTLEGTIDHVSIFPDRDSDGNQDSSEPTLASAKAKNGTITVSLPRRNFFSPWLRRADLGVNVTLKQNPDASSLNLAFKGVTAGNLDGLPFKKQGIEVKGIGRSTRIDVVAPSVPIAQISGRYIGENITVVSGQENVTVFSFDARASSLSGPVQDERLTAILLSTVAGDARNLEFAQLWADTNGDNKTDTSVGMAHTNVGTEMTFELRPDAGLLPKNNQPIRFEVKAEAGTPGTVRLALTGASVELVASGETLPPSAVHLAQNGGPLVTIVNQGTLEMNTGPVRRQYLLAGQVTQNAYNVTLQAGLEDVAVYRLPFKVITSGQSTPQLYLYLPGDNIPDGVATLANDVPGSVPSYDATFFGSPLIVQAGTQLDVRVGIMPPSDLEGGQSGDELWISLTDETEAYGVTSSRRIAAGGHVVSSPVHTVVTAKVTSVINASTAADDSAIPIGTREIGAWTITTASHNNTNWGLDQVHLGALNFWVDTQNVQIKTSSVRLYSKANPAIKINAQVIDQAGNPISTPTFTGRYGVYVVLDYTAIENLIGPGGSLTLAMEAEVVNAKVDPTQPSSLQAILRADEVSWYPEDAKVPTGPRTYYRGFRLTEAEYKSTRFSS